MLRLVDKNRPRAFATPLVDSEALGHHQNLLEGFYLSHRIRGHAESTIALYRKVLSGWFRQFGTENMPLLTWQAMEPIVGRERIREYGRIMVEAGLTVRTLRSYLLTLNQYFAFVLDHPYVQSQGQNRRIDELYGEIRQPISEFELPVHNGDAELSLPFDPEKLYDFLTLLRDHYLASSRLTRCQLTRFTVPLLPNPPRLLLDQCETSLVCF